MKLHQRILLVAMSCIALVPVSSAFADDVPAITVVQAGADRLKEDLKATLDLTSPQEQKEWETVLEYLDEVFLLGVDGSRPIRFDVVSDDDTTSLRSSFPILDDDDFIENLNLFGITTKRKTRTYYELDKAYKGILRLIDDYGVIGESRSAVPARGFEPIDDLIEKYALEKDGKTAKHDVLMILLNEDGTPKSRREVFQKNVKKELMAAVKQKEDESKEDFDLRKAITELQIDELARYYADPKELLLNWNLDAKEKKGGLKLDLLPDKKSLLESAVQKLGTRVSHFAAIPADENSVLDGTINMHLDEEQQTAINGILVLLRDRAHSEIDAAEDIKGEQKTAFKDAISKLIDSSVATVKETGLDGYVQCLPKGDKHTLIGAVQMSQSANITQIFQLMKVVRPERKIELDVDKQGDVAIHMFEFSEKALPAMKDFFGATGVYVGVGPKSVWYAIGGESALDDLKASLDKVATAESLEPTNTFVTFKIKGAPWVAWRDRHAVADPMEAEKVEIPTEGEETKKTDLSKLPLRELAMEAFEPGDDYIHLNLSREDDRVKGEMTTDTGILRLVGKLIAKFSKDTLAD